MRSSSFKTREKKRLEKLGISLVVQWLRICSSAEAGHEFSPWQGKTLHAAGPRLKLISYFVQQHSPPNHRIPAWVCESLVSDSATLCPISPPCSSLHGVLQAGILEWVAVPFSKFLLKFLNK